MLTLSTLYWPLVCYIDPFITEFLLLHQIRFNSKFFIVDLLIITVSMECFISSFQVTCLKVYKTKNNRKFSLILRKLYDEYCRNMRLWKLRWIIRIINCEFIIIEELCLTAYERSSCSAFLFSCFILSLDCYLPAWFQ